MFKETYNTSSIYKPVNTQASVAKKVIAGFFGIFSPSINRLLLDALTNHYNKNLSTILNT